MKKLLVVLEVENTLLQTFSTTSAVKNFSGANEMRKPDVSKDGVGIHFRKGREAFLDQIMKKLSKEIDIAVWSSLNRKETELATRSYFGPYFDRLLMVMFSNRSTINDSKASSPHGAIPIARDLKLIYQKFPQFNETRTVCVSPFPNPVKSCQLNDLPIEYWDFLAKPNKYYDDFQIHALMKYLTGLQSALNSRADFDARMYSSRMSLENMSKRLADSSNFSNL